MAVDLGRIAFFLPSLRAGGVEKNTLRLARALAERGYAVDIALTSLDGEYRESVPESVNLVELAPVGIWQSRLRALQVLGRDAPVLARPTLVALKSSRILRYLPGLASYLQRQRPAALIAAMPYPNLVAAMARRLADVPTRVVVTERTLLSQTVSRLRRKWRWRYLPPVMRVVYPWADRIVAVSDAVADDLAATVGLSRNEIVTIYNPVVSPTLNEQAKARPEHAWFAAGAPPVILGAGRLRAQKGFFTLIRAFARVRARRAAKLIILGEGRDRTALEALVRTLDLADSVALPGWASNPYAYMACASAFVLSSEWEGFGNVLVEALACGCPIISTDCPGGPREILEDGKYGTLVPVDDEGALAGAMEEVLNHGHDPARLRNRAAAFSVDACAEAYRALCVPQPG